MKINLYEYDFLMLSPLINIIVIITKSNINSDIEENIILNNVSVSIF